MAEKATTFTMRVGAEEKEKFFSVCEENCQSPSSLIRKWMTAYVKEHGQELRQEQEQEQQSGGQSVLAVSLNADLRNKFSAVCKNNGYVATAVIRKLLTDWINQQENP